MFRLAPTVCRRGLLRRRGRLRLAPKGIPAGLVEAMNAAILKVTGTDEWKTMVNEYCYQDPFVLNVADSVANLKEQRDLFQSFVPFL